MVNNNFCRNAVRKCLYNKSDLPPCRVLTEPTFQDSSMCWYLVYRWLLFLCWASIILCSAFEIGSYQPKHHRYYWFIYLTNWDLILGAGHSLLGAILVTRRWRLQRQTNFEPDQMLLGKFEKTYWFLYVVTSNVAIGVTIIYWALVHNPVEHVVDPLNIMLHVCNSLLMLIDIFVSKVPFRMRSFWWCTLVVLVYLIFSLIYYAAGGRRKDGQVYIYKVLNWEKPKMTLLVCFGGLTFVVVMHCLIHYSSLFRDFACAKISRNQKENDKILKEDSSMDIVKMKKSDLIV